MYNHCAQQRPSSTQSVLFVSVYCEFYINAAIAGLQRLFSNNFYRENDRSDIDINK